MKELHSSVKAGDNDVIVGVSFVAKEGVDRKCSAFNHITSFINCMQHLTRHHISTTHNRHRRSPSPSHQLIFSFLGVKNLIWESLLAASTSH